VNFSPTPLAGVMVIELEPHKDERGFFARSFCREEFAAHDLEPAVAQCNVSYSPRKLTMRGMHYQAKPYAEAKLVRCTRGAVYDVVIDLRRDSSTFKRYFAIELSWQNHTMLYVPKGFAHGFLTLEPESEVFYQMSVAYQGESARGVRWNDPVFAIPWPHEPEVISERDASFPGFSV